MAFLTLNGILVKLAPGSAVRRARHLGQYASSYNGTAYSTVRTTKVDMACTTTPMSQAQAEVFERLVQGDGHAWSFDSAAPSGLNSSRGLPPAVASGTITTGVAAGKFGKALSAEDGSTLIWEAGITAPWTLCFWRLNGLMFHHYVLRYSAGTGYQTFFNGVRNDGAYTDILDILSTGEVYLTCSSGDETLDDLVALPYFAPDDWPAQLFASATAFGPLPKHAVGGDWLASRCTQALCRWESTEPVNGWDGGVGSVVNFELLGE
jgi:hypothetical protein